MSVEEQEKYIRNFQKKDRTEPFDLTQPRLLRLNIIKQAENQYIVFNTIHHSINDGWSAPILLQTVHHYYQQLLRGAYININEEKSYLDAQVYIAKGKNRIEQYWKQKVAIVEQTNDLTALLSHKQDLDSIRSLENAYNTDIVINGELFQNLKSITKSEGITLNTLVCASISSARNCSLPLSVK